MDKKPHRIQMVFIYKQAVSLAQGYRSRVLCVVFSLEKKKYFSSSSKQVEYAHLKGVFE